MAQIPRFDVALALINHQGKTLLGMRAQSAHAGGKFEFIGGKVEAGETPLLAIQRECLEELGARVDALRTASTLSFTYPDRVVSLHVFWATLKDKQPRPLGTESLHWVDLDQLDDLPMPAANSVIKKVAQLPKTYQITPDLETPKSEALDQASAQSHEARSSYDGWLKDRSTLPINAMVYVRLKSLTINNYTKLFEKIAKARPDLKLVCEYRAWHKLSTLCFAAQLSTQNLMSLKTLPEPNETNPLWFASVHSEDQITHANQLGVHAVTLSPINPTLSHPDALGLGWERAEQLAELCCCTVYALGGVSPSDLDRPQGSNFYGVAGIRHFS